MYHSPTNDILIFATEAGARLLVQSNCWCVDGTFKIVPSWYQQLFTLNVFMKGKLLPVLYCLNCSIPKAEKLGVQVDPAKFVCDFQTALILAIQDNFPNNQVQGFFFYKSADHKYIHNQEIRKKVKMLMALVFLPVNLVPAVSKS
ncbi:hypothetical protein T4E_8975 [Trichinella pseudospiralis]|uniref:MULE transposase domain-containing protein n=1 Tax=Trichinella pseudospiralis TaxID=6337 RepID=A0A0V0XFE7_TRIPS|nr:hypothetical protein T4E_8975 [Trichinella pseudospiralis]